MDQSNSVFDLVRALARSRSPRKGLIGGSFIETLGSAFSLDTMWSYFIVEFTDFLTVAHIVWCVTSLHDQVITH